MPRDYQTVPSLAKLGTPLELQEPLARTGGGKDTKSWPRYNSLRPRQACTLLGYVSSHFCGGTEGTAQCARDFEWEATSCGHLIRLFQSFSSQLDIPE